jgi:hypothetical protein
LAGWLIGRYPKVLLRKKELEHHRIAEHREFLAVHAELVASGEGISTLHERYNLWSLTQRLAGHPGVIGELGVYRGVPE